MIEELSPAREAYKLARLWREVKGASYPVDAGALAAEWSRQVDPAAAIGKVEARELTGFEGGLFWLKERKEWALLYNPQPNVPGRANFTIAHEFGHYVLHRKRQERFECTQRATLGMTGALFEREADQFASCLLMPIDDFKSQIGSRRVNLDLLSSCAKRYGVSLTAAMLKWAEFTEEAAVVVMGREGMLHWWRASSSAKRFTFKALREGMELPSESLAVNSSMAISAADYRVGIDHKADIWGMDVPLREMAVVSDRYDMSISLLVLDAPGIVHDEEPDQDMTNTPPRF